MDFYVTGPSGDVLASDNRQQDSLHSIDVKRTGEYSVCLDNSFSRVSEKLVFVDIIIDDDTAEKLAEKVTVETDMVANMEVDMKLQNLTVSDV